MSESAPEPEPLATLQRELLARLHAGAPLDELAPALQALAGDDETRAWLASFDPAMLALAREFARRWLRP